MLYQFTVVLLQSLHIICRVSIVRGRDMMYIIIDAVSVYDIG